MLSKNDQPDVGPLRYMFFFYCKPFTPIWTSAELSLSILQEGASLRVTPKFTVSYECLVFLWHWNIFAYQLLSEMLYYIDQDQTERGWICLLLSYSWIEWTEGMLPGLRPHTASPAHWHTTRTRPSRDYPPEGSGPAPRTLVKPSASAGCAPNVCAKSPWTPEGTPSRVTQINGRSTMGGGESLLQGLSF